jgi:hypothetical protein
MNERDQILFDKIRALMVQAKALLDYEYNRHGNFAYKLNAIRLHRHFTGHDLRTAKDWVEQHPEVMAPV